MNQQPYGKPKERNRPLISVVLLIVLLFNHTSIAHNKVVVVPLGGDEPPEVRTGSEIYTNSIGMKFSLIPAGSFVMGSPDGTGTTSSRPVNTDETDLNSNERQHSVIITKPYYMQTTEVTQAQYQQVIGSNPAWYSDSGGGPDCGLNCPVESVTWHEAQSFIGTLNLSENRMNCNTEPNTCYSLPTEAQWEYAARGATVTAFYNGRITQQGSGSDPSLDVIAWYGANASGTTHPVAEKAANQWGLYDMLGNVFEWCEDWYGAYPDDSFVEDPVGPANGSDRVVRGGSWANDARFTRSAIRDGTSPDVNDNRSLGFRIILSSS